MLYWVNIVTESLGSLNDPIVPFIAISYFIGIIIYCVYGFYNSPPNDNPIFPNFHPLTPGFFSRLSIADDKIKFLFQNDEEIFLFIFGKIISLAISALSIITIIILLAVLSGFLGYLTYNPFKYYYLLLRSDKSIIKSARTKSLLFIFFEVKINSLVVYLFFMVYTKIKNIYLE